MSDKSTSSLEILKRELSRLKSFTDTIGTAKASAQESQQAAEAAIRAAEVVHEQQKALLADLRLEHQKSIDVQSELLRTNTQQWEDALSQRLKTALQEYDKQTTELEKVAVLLRKDGQKQNDTLTSVTDRLQRISGTLTAFRDAMNAARFSDRLESIDTKQHTLGTNTQASHTELMSKLTAFEESLDLQQEIFGNQLAAVRQQVADLGKRNIILQAVLVVGVVVLIVLHFVK